MEGMTLATEPQSTFTLRQAALPLTNIELVEASYARIEPRGRAMALAFYDELFDTIPTLRAVFPRDDVEQRRIAASFIGFVVANLRAPNRLVPLLERMGERGMLQDLTREELTAVGRIVLTILRDFEGTHWTIETSHAWALCITWTIAALLRGADRGHLARTG